MKCYNWYADTEHDTKPPIKWPTKVKLSCAKMYGAEMITHIWTAAGGHICPVQICSHIVQCVWLFLQTVMDRVWASRAHIMSCCCCAPTAKLLLYVQFSTLTIYRDIIIMMCLCVRACVRLCVAVFECVRAHTRPPFNCMWTGDTRILNEPVRARFYQLVGANACSARITPFNKTYVFYDCTRTHTYSLIAA